MKIKNIRQYRTFYKEIVRDLPNRNEHHMGTFRINENGKREFGWFEVYHGDKEGYGKAEQGIGNFLQSFLDMAKDGQAVYEFLQNAVDAGASHFTMAWGKDEVDGNNYVLIANNGKMFDFDSIRSILNVGSSTKTSDSQSIGKFGIGFKLAHRLVGKENGLDELLSTEPSGPILFSWKNGEIKKLANFDPIPEPVEIAFESSNDKVKIIDNHPWLFKILITCFPALPENEIVAENIILTDGKLANTPVFAKTELSALHRWVESYSEILNDKTYREGSLFFIKLGSGKENDLADKNLGEGVRFSLTILQETAEADKKANQLLSIVQLNKGEPIHKPDLSYHYFKITKDVDIEDYLFVRFGVKTIEELTNDQISKFEKEDDIEVLFGFRGYDQIGDYFKGAPNFYLYFPLSEEVHNYNFVLHSNAFYKASSRTFLHKGTQGENGINERLLRVIARRLEKELLSLFENNEYKKFLDFYAALLTSSESHVYERQWVKEPFIDEITKVLRKLIPVRQSMNDNNFTLTHLQPKIKKTNIEVSPQIYGVSSFNWFYWGPDASDIIREKAFQKLNPLPFDIFILLQKQDIHTNVNQWIEAERSRVNVIFEELQYFNKERAQSNNFKNNLKALKLFEFTDGKLMSDNEIATHQDEGYLILHNNLLSVKEFLENISIKTSLGNLDDYDFFIYYSPYLNTNGQLRSQAKIIEIISSGNVEQLKATEKLSVFATLRDMIDDKKIERLSELRIFGNTKGQCVKLKHLLKSTEKNWLKPYVIDSAERNKELEIYLLTDESKVYENVIKPFWHQIATGLMKTTSEVRKQTFEEIDGYYELCNEDDEVNLSIENNTLFFQGDIIEVENPYYHSNLIKLPEQSYQEIQSLLNDKFGIQIPDRDFLFAYELDSLRIVASNHFLSESKYQLKKEDISNFLQFVGTVNFNLFSQYCVTEDDASFSLFIGSERNYFVLGNHHVDDYIKKHLASSLIKLPDSLNEYGNLVSIKNETLFNELVDQSNDDNFDDLINVVGSASLDIKTKLFNKLETINLKFYTSDVLPNKTRLTFICDLIGEDGLDLKVVQDKIIIKTEEITIALSELDVANDQLIIEHRGSQIQLSRSKLLNLSNKKAIPNILSFAQQAVEQSFLTEKISRKIFKISSENIADELIDRVISSIKEQGNKIFTTDQLILAVHYALNKDLNLSEFLVETINDNWATLEGNFIVSSEEFDLKWYNEANILSSRYADFGKKINLRTNEIYVYLEETSEDKSSSIENCFYYDFTFQNGVTPDVLKPQDEKVGLLNFLNGQWHQTQSQSRIKLINYNWIRLFGFNPSEKVLSNEVLETEILEEIILDWLKESTLERERFLRHIGVHISDSKIVKFRKWLLNAIDGVPNPISVEDIPLNLVSNTFVGLADGFAQTQIPFKCSIQSNKHQVIEHLITNLLESDESLEIRLPVWHDENHIELGDGKVQWPFYLGEDELSLLTRTENRIAFNKLIETVKLIYPSETYNAFAQSNYQKLESNIIYKGSKLPIEHNEPFYVTWSREHSMRLYRCEKLIYEFNIEVDGESIVIGSIEVNNVEVIEEENGNRIICYQRLLSFESLSGELSSLGYNDESQLVDQLIDSRDKMLSAFYHALTSSGRDDFDSEDSKKILEVLNERSLDEKRNEIIEEIRGSDKYSYNWFISYINYLLTFEVLSDTISQKSISFQKIEKFSSDGVQSKKYFTLRGANSLIPLNIEAFENFSIKLIFSNRQRENIVVEGVSKKGQDLLVYVPQGIDDKLVSNFDRVVNISINFTPVLDLFQRLANAFSNEETVAPWNNIQDSLPPLHFIYGPPGTGKTTKLVDTLLGKFEEDFNFKALMLVPTNKAGDVLAKRLVEKNNQIGVLRIGGPTDPELEQINEDIYQISVDENLFDSSNVIITTIHRLPYYQISVEHGASFKLFDREKTKWDLVIFDESSMISLPYFAFALHALFSKEKIIIAGDPKQIPPVVDVSDKKLEELAMGDESIYKMLNIESFDHNEQTLRAIDSIDNLDIQYRSVEVIGNLFSRISYKSLLKHGRDFENKPIKVLPEIFFGSLKSNISFIDLPIDLSNSIMEPKKLLYSPYHVYSGIIAAELISNLDKCIDGSQKYTIGIISPYKAQAMLMNKLITSSGISENISVFCDTVHGFQGDECDIVIFVVNPNNTYYTGHPNSLLSKEYIYNVAISRSKDYLWVLCPFNAIKNNTHINKLMEVAGSKKTLVQSENLEKYLFGEKDYIVRNTYLTGHDNINVFGQVEMSYFIKAGATAIDIQLRK